VLVVFSVIVPKATLVAFMLSLGDAAGFNCNATLFDAPPELAVIVAVCVVLTALIDAENVAAVEPAGTVTEAGTATALLLLANVTAWPVLGAAPDNVAVQLSVAAPVMEVAAQLTALIWTVAVETECFLP
jgi:hypothetical protein